MGYIKNIGLVIFLIGLGIFTALPFLGEFELTRDSLEKVIRDRGVQSEIFIKEIEKNVMGREFKGMMDFSSRITDALEDANSRHRQNKEYGKIIYIGPHDIAATLAKSAGKGFLIYNRGLMWMLSFGMGILGALLFIVPNAVLLGKKGIK